MTGRIEVLAVAGLPEVRPGDDLAALITGAVDLVDGDVVVVTQKVVSKAEDRLVDIDPEVGHRPLVERESVRILRRRGDLVIAETEHGFVCANAGVDLSNVEAEGMACVVTNTVMSSPEVAAELSRRILGCVGVAT